MLARSKHDISSIQGFTLIELILVIVLLGIIGSFTFSYLKFGTQIFTQAVEREQLTAQSRFILERLSRELQDSLPRSVRVSSDRRCLEFVPLIAAGRYTELPHLTPSEPFIILPAQLSSMQLENTYVFVYATQPSFIYGETESIASRRKLITSANYDHNNGRMQLQLANNAAYFPTHSPSRRYYVAREAVSWCLSNQGTLVRFARYGFPTFQPSFNDLASPNSSAQQELMAEHLVVPTGSLVGPFKAVPATLQRSSLVQFDFLFTTKQPHSEPLRILHEVHIPNVP